MGGGAAGGGGGPTSGPQTAGPLKDAAPARVRRLTARELRSSVGDVFFGGKAPAATFGREELPHAFDNLADALSVPLDFAADLQAFAEKVGADVAASLPTLSPCDAKGTEEACATKFIDTFGPRLYRRPLPVEARATLVEVYQGARKAGADLGKGIAAIVEAMVQSPYFVFRTELGEGGTPASGRDGKDGKIVRLGPYEIASALSYFLWSSTPDQPLLDAAKAGKLSSQAEIEAQARRMLEDPRAKETLRELFMQWFELDETTNASKPNAEFTPAIAAAMAAEARAFLTEVVDKEASVSSLLTSRSTFVNADLAKLYGLPATGMAAELKPATMDGTRRAGIFGLAAFMTVQTRGEFSPIFLGKFVRTKMLCQTLADAPPNVPPPPPASTKVSTRDRFKAHTDNAGCAACHTLMDPIGFSFERFDAMGRYRESERGGFALTGEGALTGTDVDGPFVGPVELGKKLAASASVRRCMAGQIAEFALGRAVATPTNRLPIDDRTLDALMGQAKSGAGVVDARALMAAVATSDSFLYRDVSGLPAGGK
jgi:hypothetical protein